MPEVKTITLDSCTVFWEDLMSERQISELGRDDRKADRVLDEFRTWLTENASGAWNVYGKGIWFARSIDAIHFKLAWAGEIKT